MTTITTFHARRHEPSPQEIRRRCQEVQKGWSFDERLRRAGIRVDRDITFVPPETRLLEALNGMTRDGRAA